MDLINLVKQSRKWDPKYTIFLDSNVTCWDKCLILVFSYRDYWKQGAKNFLSHDRWIERGIQQQCRCYLSAMWRRNDTERSAKRFYRSEKHCIDHTTWCLEIHSQLQFIPLSTKHDLVGDNLLVHQAPQPVEMFGVHDARQVWRLQRVVAIELVQDFLQRLHLSSSIISQGKEQNQPPLQVVLKAHCLKCAVRDCSCSYQLWCEWARCYDEIRSDAGLAIVAAPLAYSYPFRSDLQKYSYIGIACRRNCLLEIANLERQRWYRWDVYYMGIDVGIDNDRAFATELQDHRRQMLRCQAQHNASYVAAAYKNKKYCHRKTCTYFVRACNFN